MSVSIGMTHTQVWTGSQKGRNDNIRNRHQQMGARINANDHLEFYRPDNDQGPGIVINSVNTEDADGNNLTITISDAEYQFLDAGGSGIDVTLPAEADSTGYRFYIFNTGGETLTVKDDGGSTIITIATTKSGMVVCNGTVWKGILGA